MGRHFMAVVLAAAALLSGGATSNSTLEWTYVARSVDSISPEAQAEVRAGDRHISAAPHGWVTFQPLQDRFELRLDDATGSVGTIHVSVRQGRSQRELCVPTSTSVTVRRIDPRQSAQVVIWDATSRHQCSGTATIGTVLILP